MSEEHRKAFMEKFPEDKRNIVTQIFCTGVRIGNKNISDLLLYANNEAAVRSLDYARDANQEAMKLLLELIHTEEVRNFANFILWREALPQEERIKLKAKQSATYVNAKMEGEPPTDKQLKYLVSLGCKEVPTNKLRASQLISELVGKK
jgi:hypothetical protein